MMNVRTCRLIINRRLTPPRAQQISNTKRFPSSRTTELQVTRQPLSSSSSQYCSSSASRSRSSSLLGGASAAWGTNDDHSANLWWIAAATAAAATTLLTGSSMARTAECEQEERDYDHDDARNRQPKQQSNDDEVGLSTEASIIMKTSLKDSPPSPQPSQKTGQLEEPSSKKDLGMAPVSPQMRLITKSGVRDPMTTFGVRALKTEKEQQMKAERTMTTDHQQTAVPEESIIMKTSLKDTPPSPQPSQKTGQLEEPSKKDVGVAPVSPQMRLITKSGVRDPMTTFGVRAEKEQQLEAKRTMTTNQQQTAVQATSSAIMMDPAIDPMTMARALGDNLSPAEAKIEEATRKAKQHSGGLKIFSGNGNLSLTLDICRHLGVNLGKATVGRFADGEVNVVIHENVRGKDVYLVQPTCPPVNDNIMELLLIVSTLRRASARRITVVIPYYGYARQDRKMQARVPISAADVARLMESMGVDRVIAVDLHCGQIQGFFGPRVPVDNLDGGVVGLDYFGCKDLHNPVVVSPDAGGVYRAKKFKEGLEQKYDMQDLSLAMIVKQRARAGSVDQMDLVGDVRDCDCIIVDDMIDTAGTLCKAADVLVANGARRVFAFASHGLLSGPGNERIANSKMEEVVILNTIPTSPQRETNEKLTELSVAPLLAQAIFNIHAKKSISALFK